MPLYSTLKRRYRNKGRKAGRRKTRRSRRGKRRATVSKRRILNVSTTKKRDVVLGSGPSAADIAFQAGAGVQINPAGASFLYCPTYRFLGNSDRGYNSRQRQQVYFRGTKEKCRMLLGDGVPYQWRRIVYGTWQQRAYAVSQSTNNPQNLGRTQVPLTSQQQTEVYGELFTGTIGIDWNSIFTAKPDTTRVSILYDKTRTITPQTAGGAIKTFNMWHGINRTIAYADEEAGGYMQTSGWCAEGRNQMNYYIVDMFTAAQNTAANMNYAVESASYWHER